MNLAGASKRLFSTLSYFLLSYGLASYIVVLLPLVKYRNGQFKKPFYQLCISMAFFDIFGIFVKILTPIFEALMTPQYWLTARIYGYVSYIPWWGVQLHQLLVAVDRWVTITGSVGPEPVVFSNTRMKVMISVIWFIAVVCNLVMVRDVGFQSLIYVTIVILYVLTFVYIRKTRNQVQETSQIQRSKTEIRLLILGMIVTVPQATAVFTFGLILVSPAEIADFLLLFVELGNILYNRINPFVYILFSTELRRKMVDYYYPKMKINKEKGPNRQKNPKPLPKHNDLQIHKESEL